MVGQAYSHVLPETVANKVRTKVRNPLALGTSKHQAIMRGVSSKSYWHLSRTLAPQTGLTNDWLNGRGLISVRDFWMNAYGYA